MKSSKLTCSRIVADGVIWRSATSTSDTSGTTILGVTAHSLGRLPDYLGEMTTGREETSINIWPSVLASVKLHFVVIEANRDGSPDIVGSISSGKVLAVIAVTYRSV